MLFLYFGASVEFNNAIEKKPISEKNILTSNLITFQYIQYYTYMVKNFYQIIYLCKEILFLWIKHGQSFLPLAPLNKTEIVWNL